MGGLYLHSTCTQSLHSEIQITVEKTANAYDDYIGMCHILCALNRFSVQKRCCAMFDACLPSARYLVPLFARSQLGHGAVVYCLVTVNHTLTSSAGLSFLRKQCVCNNEYVGPLFLFDVTRVWGLTD